MDAKQQQFLWVVQTYILVNAANLTETALSTITSEALTESEVIPEGQTAFHAAYSFCERFLDF